MTKRKSLTVILTLILAICVVCFLGSLIPIKATAAGYPFRYDDPIVGAEDPDGQRMQKYYLKHWSVGQDQRAGDENSGTWSFGYGTINTNTNTYSYTKATKDDSVAGDSSRYTTGSAHQLCYGFNASTRCDSNGDGTADNNDTQTMFVWTAEAKGTVSFTGMYSRRASTATDLRNLVMTQNTAYTDFWLPGVNAAGAGVGFTSGEYYTTGIFVYDASENIVGCNTYKAHSGEYAWMVDPNTVFNVDVGDQIAFGLHCGSIGTLANEWATGTLALFSSKFTHSTYSVTVNNDNTKGTVSGISNATGVALNTSYNISVVPQVGYQIKSIYWGSTKLNVTDKFSFAGSVSVTSDSALTVEYETAYYQVTVNNDYEKGSLTGVASGVGYTNTDLRNIVVTAKQGYEISSITFGSENITISDKYTVSFQKYITGNVALTVTYAQVNYTVTLDYDNSLGSISGVTNGGTYPTGISQAIVINANENCVITSIKYGAEDISVLNGKTVAITKKLTANTTIKVTFVDNSVPVSNYNLTVTNDNNKGTIVGAETKSYVGGTALLITITANENYNVTSVKWNGVDVTELVNEKSVALVRTLNENSTLTVEYASAITTAKATISSDVEKGVIYGLNEVADFTLGTSRTITITALNGYKISSVTWNGSAVEVTNQSSFSFTKQIGSANALVVSYVAE